VKPTHAIFGFHAVLARLRADAASVMEVYLDQDRKDARARDLTLAAERAGVQVGRGAGDFHFKIAQPPQAVADRRDPLAQHGGVAHQQAVASEQVLLPMDEFVNVLAAHFLLAFDDELDVHRQLALHLHERLEGLEVHEHLSLVVHHAARVEVAVAQGQLPRG